MRAILSPETYSILTSDLAQAVIAVRYRKDGEVKNETVYRPAYPESIGLVADYLVVSDEYEPGRSVSEKIKTIIPLEDVVDITVDTVEYSESVEEDENPYTEFPLSHWRRNRHGELKRLALDA